MKFLFGSCAFLLVLANLAFGVSQISIPLQKKVYDSRRLSSLRKRITTSKDTSLADSHLMKAYYAFNETLQFADPLYSGEIMIGSQNQTFEVVFDTGSDILWLPAPRCQGCSMYTENYFHCSESTTCSQSSTLKQETYGTGDIQGYEAQDNVMLMPGFSVNYQFTIVEEASDLSDFPADGLMGLNNDNSQLNFVDLAYSAGYIVDKVFSFQFAQEFSSANSFLNIGYIPTNHVNNVIWLPATNSMYWSTDVLAMTVNDESIPFGDDSDITSVLFDSGTSDLLLANPVYQVVIQQLRANGCHITSNSNSYSTCPCYKEDLPRYPNITFSTRGANFTITPNQYLMGTGTCRVYLGTTYLPELQSSAGRQILGAPFMISNFVTFSKRNQTLGLDAPFMAALTPINNNIYFWSGIGAIALMLVSLIVIFIIQKKFKPKDNSSASLGYNALRFSNDI